MFDQWSVWRLPPRSQRTVRHTQRRRHALSHKPHLSRSWAPLPVLPPTAPPTPPNRPRLATIIIPLKLWVLPALLAQTPIRSHRQLENHCCWKYIDTDKFMSSSNCRFFKFGLDLYTHIQNYWVFVVVLFLRRWQSRFYYTLSVFIGSASVGRTIKQSKKWQADNKLKIFTGRNTLLLKSSYSWNKKWIYCTFTND